MVVVAWRQGIGGGEWEEWREGYRQTDTSTQADMRGGGGSGRSGREVVGSGIRPPQI